jgi:CRP-like cAMP-binding protein
MENEELFKLLASMYPISAAFSAAVENVLVRLSLPKNHTLVEPPNVASHVYFILSGFAVSYSYIKEKKSIDWLWPAGEIIVSAKSFTERRPSNEFIELVQPCELVCISHKNLAKLFDSFPETHYLYRATMNQYFEHSRERLSDMKNLTALQRYDKLTKRISFIEQTLSQEQIASYLGIAPQSLSRMKRRSDRP